MTKITQQSTASQLKYQIPLCIICSFVLTLLLPDFVYILNPELYCIWFPVIWSLNMIFDQLVYVIFTKLQHRKDRKNKNGIYKDVKSAQLPQKNSREHTANETICHGITNQVAVIESIYKHF